MMLLCDDTQAPIWLPRGRVAKYFSVSADGIFAAVPRIEICRASSRQKNNRATLALAAM